MKVFETTGCQTESQQMKYTTNAIFISQFVNTGIMLLVVNANLEFQGGPLKKVFHGTDPDFNQRWFSTVGDTIVGSMFFNIYFPLLEALLLYGIRSIRRLIDKSCYCRNQRTK